VLHQLLIQRLIGPRLEAEVNSICTILRSFDLWVQCPSPEVQEVLLKYLVQEQELSPFAFSLAQTWNEVVTLTAKSNELRLQNGSTYMVYVGNEPLPQGSGFGVYKVGNMDELLPSMPSTILTILKHFHHEMYMDVFDAENVGLLREALRVRGLAVTIDAVNQIALKAGFLGHESEAKRYLHALANPSFSLDNPKDGVGSALPPAESVFLSVLAQTQQPHSFLKAALSYYTVKTHGNSMSRASRRLNISRTTLQEHLKLAEQMEVHRIFPGMS
jgi:hypothetical protein